MRTRFGPLVVEVTVGDITTQNGIDAVVNAANAALRSGGGVAGAIHAAAGPGLERECLAQAPISCGQAVISGAHDLPNRHVIHCLGPVYGRDEPAARLLAECYETALRLADEHRLTSIAFPAISTGVFGYPMAQAARVALEAVKRHSGRLDHLRLVRFCLFDEDAAALHRQALDALASGFDQQE